MVSMIIILLLVALLVSLLVGRLAELALTRIKSRMTARPAQK
jgi:hypothetical protein